MRVVRTAPVARRSRSSSHASRSNPPGFCTPCGRFSRTANCQRSAGFSAGASLYQPSKSRRGTATSGVSTRSTSNSKRTPRSSRAGSDETTPSMTMSLPSSAKASASARRNVAWTPACRNPAASATPTPMATRKPGAFEPAERGHAAAAATNVAAASSASTVGDGNSACNCKRQMPPTNAASFSTPTDAPRSAATSRDANPCEAMRATAGSAELSGAMTELTRRIFGSRAPLSPRAAGILRSTA